MSFLVTIAMFGWIPAVVFIFALFPARKAVITSFLVGWLFLPCVGYEIPGLPNYTKMSATCLGIMLATAIYHTDSFRLLRPSMYDLPLAVWCIAPFFSSMTNGLGPYDGLSGTLNHFFLWGFPYLVGRLHFRDLRALRELAIGVVMGGLIYVPFCLFEIRMSPQLHAMVYGFSPGWGNVRRLGGWRPMVFLDDGLMLGLWMATASLVGLWLWYAGGLRQIRSIPAKWLIPLLVVTSILCKSTGAIVLLVLGFLSLLATRRFATRYVLIALTLLPIVYMVARSTGGWSGKELLTAASYISEDREGSLRTRIENEDILSAHALQRPLFGWGSWGRNRPEGTHTVTDGLWVLVLGMNGIFGLAGITLVQLVPAIVLLRRIPPSQWSHPLAAAPTVLVMCLLLYCLDNLLNALPNPLFLLIAGAIVSTLALAPAAGMAAQRNRRRSRIMTPAEVRAPAPGSVPAGGGNRW